MKKFIFNIVIFVLLLLVGVVNGIMIINNKRDAKAKEAEDERKRRIQKEKDDAYWAERMRREQNKDDDAYWDSWNLLNGP